VIKEVSVKPAGAVSQTEAILVLFIGVRGSAVFNVVSAAAFEIGTVVKKFFYVANKVLLHIAVKFNAYIIYIGKFLLGCVVSCVCRAIRL
jgi:hypothetical protein